MMKTIKLLLLTVLCSAVYTVRAEVAFVKLNYVMQLVPETKQAEEAVKAFQIKLNNQLQNKIAVCQEEATALEKGRASMTEEAIKKKEANLTRLYTDFQNFQQECQSLIENKAAELRSPITEKVKQKIQEVAKEKGYDLVFNYGFSNDDDLGLMVVYGEAKLDITNIVLKKLGIDPTATKKAGPANNNKENQSKAADNIDPTATKKAGPANNNKENQSKAANNKDKK